MAKYLKKVRGWLKKAAPDLCFVGAVGIGFLSIYPRSPEVAGVCLAIILFFVGKGMKN